MPSHALEIDRQPSSFCGPEFPLLRYAGNTESSALGEETGYSNIIRNWLVAGNLDVVIPAEDSREEWLRDALEQYGNLDQDAREDGLDPPSEEARQYASCFIHELHERYHLPLASVFADEKQGVSIQMEAEGVFFLLTCLAGGHGTYTIVRKNYSLETDFRVSSVSRVPYFIGDHLHCLLGHLRKNASPTY